MATDILPRRNLPNASGSRCRDSVACLETPDSRRRMRKRNLPPAHTEVPDAHEQRAIFELWLRIAVRIGRYVYENDVRHLPTDDELDGLFDELGLAPWMSSSTEEEVSGMK